LQKSKKGNIDSNQGWRGCKNISNQNTQSNQNPHKLARPLGFKGFFFLFSDSPQIYKRKDVLDKFVVTQTKQNEKFRKKKKIFFQRVKYDNNLGTFRSNG